MTSREAIERALRKIKPDATAEEKQVWREALAVSIQSALRSVAELMALRAPEDVERQLLETTTTVDLADGVANLATYVATNPTHITKTIDRGKIIHSDSTYPLQELPDEMSLNLPWPKSFIYFCISGNKLKTLNTDGLLTSLTGTLTITLLAVPTLANLPQQLEPHLIEAMVAEIGSGQKAKTSRKERSAS